MKHPDSRIEALLAGLTANTRLPPIDLGLDRVVRLLEALGNPQDKLPPVVHVAGTNGKGSLLAYLSAIFSAAGIRAHRYTSPHLVRFNERIVLAGEEITDDVLQDPLQRVGEATKNHPVTFFEATTATAFLAFAETPADIVLLETGLGGRLDATNVTVPVLTAITPVSMDHTEYLGTTLAAIAGEKAGIIKKGVPVITGPQQPEARVIIEQVANNLSAPLYRFDMEWRVREGAKSFQYHSAERDAEFALPGLAGAHQVTNAATAIACLDCLKNFPVSTKHINEGLANARWPARLQQLTQGSLCALMPPGGELWLDGGHNPGAGRVLAAWAAKQRKPVHLICGMLKNKDMAGFLAPLAAHVKSLTAVAITDEPQSADPSVISATAANLDIQNAIAPEVKDAIKSIVNKQENNLIILVCGSLYLAGNILWQNGQKA